MKLIEVPDRIWWCHTCDGGVGCWVLDHDKPPPRCPAYHEHNFVPIKFIPAANVSNS